MNDTPVSRNYSEDVTQKILMRVRGLSDPNRRRAEGCFWAEGIRNFIQAVEAHWPIDAVVHSPVLLQGDFAEKILRRKKREGVRCIRISPEQFRAISTAERASGVGVVCRQRWMPLEQLDPMRGLCVLVVEHIRSPGNLGTILRTAEACGAAGVIFLGAASDPFHPAVVRASMGGLMRLCLSRGSPKQFRAWAAQRDVHVVGLSPESPPVWRHLSNRRPMAIVLGQERKGLSSSLREICDQFVSLPMSGRADSLNVSIAAGVVMYELVRRQNKT